MNNTLFLPHTFNPNEHPNGYYIALLLHIICFRYFTDRRFKKGDEIPLRGDYLTEILPSGKYKTILNYCENNDIIQINHHYVKGSQCKKYGIGYQYFDNTIIHYEIDKPTIIKKLNKLKQYNRKLDRANFNTTHKYLMNVIEKRIDYSGITSLSPENIWYFVGLNEDEDKNPTEQFECAQNTIYRLEQKDYTGKVDKNGRFYSPLTELQSEMRDLLLLDGEPIIFQDISHTHPLMLCILLDSVLTQKHEIAKFFNYINYKSSNFIHTPLMISLFEKEVFRFKKLVCEAGLYKLLCKDLNIDDSMGKKQLMSFLYDRNRDIKHCKYTKWFNDNFYYIHSLLQYYKQDDHRFISNYLFQIESQIMIDSVSKELICEHPGIPIVTVHDCIGTTAKYKQIVYDKLMSEFKLRGLTPTIKEKS